MRSVRLTIFGIFSYLFILQAAVCVLGLPRGFRGAADFRHLYTAGYMIRTGHGHDLYDYALEGQFQSAVVGRGSPIPFDHLAYEALLFVPFSLLKYSTAYVVFAGVNFLLLVAAQRLFRSYLAPLEILGKWVPEAMFFCFLPVVITILLGQDSLVLLALAVGAFILIERGHDGKAGLLLSLGFFKFQFVVPVILLFLLWRRWRFVLGAALGAAAAVGLSLWTAGVSGMLAFTKTLVAMSAGLASEAQKAKFGTYPIVMPNLRGFIDTIAGAHASTVAIQVAIAVFSLLAVLVASRMRPSLPLALLAAVLVSYHGLIHDASLLILPLGVVLVRSVRERNLLLGALVMLIFVTPAVLFQFSHSRYFPMAILLLALLLAWKRLPQHDDRVSAMPESAVSGSAEQKLLA